MLKTRYTKWIALLGIVISLALVAAACAGEEEEEAAAPAAEEPVAAAPAEKKGPIKIAELNWTSQVVNANLMKTILEDYMNYEVELIFADSLAMFASIAEGDLHYNPETWPSSSFAEMEHFIVETQTVEDLGPMGMIGQVEWYVPAYVVEGDPERGIEACCPDLTSWEQLIKYKDEFVTSETAPRGQLVSTPIDWPIFDQERLDALGLDFETIHAGSGAALEAAFIGAYERGEPIIITFWEPHWLHSRFETRIIELPVSTDECWATDFACGFPADILFSMVWPGVKEQFPDAYELLSNFQLENDQSNFMTGLVDVDRKTVEEAIQSWMDANPEVWTGWLPEAIRADVRTELGL